MFCRQGCRCEQQYRLHRLLAYDPSNDCRGIFSDWFKFPSCCVCRCYDLPTELRLTSRSPRSPTTKQNGWNHLASFSAISKSSYWLVSGTFFHQAEFIQLALSRLFIEFSSRKFLEHGGRRNWLDRVAETSVTHLLSVFIRNSVETPQN